MRGARRGDAHRAPLASLLDAITVIHFPSSCGIGNGRYYPPRVPQVFHRSTNTIARVSIFGALIVVAVAGFGLDLVNRSAHVTQAGIAHEQPVPFSHRHHAGELGIDCRYCHTSVETRRYSGHPADPDLHELPLRRSGPTARRSSPCARASAPDVSIPWIKRPRSSRLRLLQSSASTSRRASGARPVTAAVDRMNLDLAAELAADGVVPRLPPQSGALRASRARRSSRCDAQPPAISSRSDASS